MRDPGEQKKALIEEARAWLLIAEHWLFRPIVHSGLCWYIKTQAGNGTLLREIADAMGDRLEAHVPNGGFLEEEDGGGRLRTLPDYAEGTYARVTFCCLMAAQCRDEAQALSPRSPKRRKNG